MSVMALSDVGVKEYRAKTLFATMPLTGYEVKIM